MGRQLDSADIFAMANCITLDMPRIYSAHGLTMDMFLNQVEPGNRVHRSNINLWPDHFVRVFKIPQTVKLFIFSVFNEIYLPSYVWKEDAIKDRFTIGFHKEQYDPIRILSNEVERLDTESFCDRLIEVSKKVDRIWKAKKMFLRYDKSRATQETKDLFHAYEEAVESKLNWPIVEVHDDKGPPWKKNQPYLWCHYAKVPLRKLYLDIVEELK